MKLGGMIPFLNVRHLYVEKRMGGGDVSTVRVRRDDRHDMAMLYRMRDWDVEGIAAVVRQYDGTLWPVIVLTLAQPERRDG